MMLLVVLTGGFGFLASFCMLHLGLDSMAVRYPLALACSYLFFLFLIWLWLRTNASGYTDFPDFSGVLPSGGPSATSSEVVSGGGGGFGGGGASGTFETLAIDSGSAAEVSTSFVGDAAGSIGDVDEMVIPLVVIVLAVGLALASLYVVYIAPALFAEVLVDGLLSYALFRNLKTEERPSWLAGALRRTIIPFVATAIFLAATGFAMSLYAPGARSVGQVIGYANALNAEQ